MKTKIVYVLVSGQDDLYLEQAFVSMYSVKHHQPDARIVLVIDSITNSTIDEERKKELEYVDDLIVVDLDNEQWDSHNRSRLLKTNLREYVEGDFLFIDTDTIIVKPLFEIDSCSYDIAACWDSHSGFENNPYRSMCLRDGKKLKWDIESEDAYYNSGVIFCKDTPSTHSFYRAWNSNWKEGLKVGVKMDQPSFAKSNYELSHMVRRLPDIWNCELKHGVKFLKDAVIVHYLCTNNVSTPPFMLNSSEFLNTVKETKSINEGVRRIVDDPFEGICTPTLLLSGPELSFLQTDLYKDILSNYLNEKLPLFYSMENKLRRVYDKFLRIHNKVNRMLRK